MAIANVTTGKEFGAKLPPGYVPYSLAQKEFKQLIEDEIEFYGKLARALNISPE